MSKVVTDEIMQELINKLEELVNNYCYNIEHFTEDEIDSFFQASQEEVTYYNSLINDNIESQNFIWSSKKVATKISEAIIEADKYADSLIKNIASIKLQYVDTLPTSDISENTIYILKSSDASAKDTLNLYNPTDGWTSIGNFDISLDGYYTKNEVDTLLANKANSTEVLKPEDIKTDLTATDLTNGEVAGALATKTEFDKKFNKSNIVTTINSTSTDDTVPSAKTVYTAIKIASGYAEKSVDDCNNCITTGYYVASSTCINVPSGEKYGILKVYGRRTDIESSNSQWIIQEYTSTSGKRYIRSSVNANSLTPTNWGSWKRLCNTDVSDVDRTAITLSDTTYFELSSKNSSYYSVTNGICTVRLELKGIKEYNATFDTDLVSLPKPKEVLYQSVIDRGMGDGKAVFQLNTQGKLRFVSRFTDNPRIYVSFTYPVAES